jgi:hypothetical protein
MLIAAPPTKEIRTVLLPLLVLAAALVTAPAAAGCAADLVAVERKLHRAAPPAEMRRRAQREIEVARRASSERSCLQHLETAMQLISPAEPQISTSRRRVDQGCEFDPTCTSTAAGADQLQATPGGYGGRRCRRDGTC